MRALRQDCDDAAAQTHPRAAINGTWVLEQIGAGQSSTSIALDTAGTVHVAYADGSLTLATNEGIGWALATVDPSPSFYVDLSLDSADAAHISYTHGFGDWDIRHATNASGQWSSELVDPGVHGQHTSIAIDLADAAHVSYFDWTNQGLRYATNASGAWVAETVDAVGQTGVATDIALDAAGSAHIAYQDVTWSDLRYATNSSGEWRAETVDAGGATGGVPSLVVDAFGVGHIVYYDSTDQDLRYATNAGGAWTRQTIDSAGNAGSSTSLAVDIGGGVHIAYEARGHLQYATNRTGGWTTETVDGWPIRDPATGQGTSIAVGTDGSVHISYTDAGAGNMRYARLDGVGTPDTFGNGIDDDCDGVDGRDSDGDGYASIASGGTDCDDTRLDVNPNAQEDNDTWFVEDLDAEFDNGGHTSIDVDFGGEPQISYQSGFSADLRLASHEAGAWIVRTVDAAVQATARETSLALGQGAAAHIAYSNDGDLRYATNRGFGWTLQTVDLDFLSGYYPSIALDASGAAHISYHDRSNGYLRYAADDSGLWAVETVDSRGCPSQFGWAGTGFDTSVAVAADGAAHVSYREVCAAELRYATNAGGSWVLQTVDSRADAGYGTSIALDAMGAAHIGYLDFDPDWLVVHATNASGVWDTEAVAALGASTAENTSIAIDGDGSVHLLYYESWDDELRYATNASGIWVTELVTRFCGDAGMALDRHGVAHVSCFRSDSHVVRYARRGDGVDADCDGT